MIVLSIGRRVKNFVKVKIYWFTAKLKYCFSSPDNNNYQSDKDPGEGFKRWYFNNGNVKAEFYQKKGKVEGIANMYYENGAVKAREFYRDDHLQGLSKWYYETGELKSEKYYDEGSLVYTKEYDKKGKMISNQTFQDIKE